MVLMTRPLFPHEQSEKSTDDVVTPRWIFDTLGLTFDLDVASPPWPTHVPAARFYTKADDGLSQPWVGRVWMNPPFSQSTAWVNRFMEHRNGIACLPLAKSAWTIRIWESDAVIALPGRWFDWAGSYRINWGVFFAAYGTECVEALHRLGPVR